MGRINIYRYTLTKKETFPNILNGNYITRISDGKLNIEDIKIEDLTGLTATPIIDFDQQNTGNNIKSVKLFYHETYKKDIILLDFIDEIDSIDILSDYINILILYGWNMQIQIYLIFHICLLFV